MTEREDIDPALADEVDPADGLPPEAVEEARRLKDIPVESPEDSTGIDV